MSPSQYYVNPNIINLINLMIINYIYINCDHMMNGH